MHMPGSSHINYSLPSGTKGKTNCIFESASFHSTLAHGQIDGLADTLIHRPKYTLNPCLITTQFLTSPKILILKHSAGYHDSLSKMHQYSNHISYEEHSIHSAL